MHIPNEVYIVGSKDYLCNNGNSTLFDLQRFDCFSNPIFVLHLTSLVTYEDEIANAQTNRK